MFNEEQLNNYADVLLWGLKKARTRKFKKNDIIIIRYDRPAIDLAEILYKKILVMGLNPLQRMGGTSCMERSFFEVANDKQLIFQPPGEEELFNNINGSIYLHAPESITHLKGIDPKKIAKTAVSRKKLRDILDRREEEGAFGWTLCIFPTQELAKHARLSFADYTNQIIKACYLNEISPAEKWQNIYKEVSGIKKWLNSLKIRTLLIESENIDLEITPGEKRRWLGVSGHNIPSFEIFLSPDYHNTRGKYYANQPSYRSGNYIKGIRLEFANGSIVKVEAEEGEEFAKNQFAIDKGANKIGEFSLTDKNFSMINNFMANTLFDENYGGEFGNCHIALGSSYSDTFDGDPKILTKKQREKLGFNDSALHWDIVNTEKKTVTAYLPSGKKIIIYENGSFVI